MTGSLRIALLIAASAAALGGCAKGKADGAGLSEPTESKPQAVAPSKPASRTPVAERSYAPWPVALHDSRHSSAAPVNGPVTGKIAWRRTLEGPVVPGPVVGRGGVAYAASNGGVLHALQVSDGGEVWSFDGGGAYGSDLSSSPAILRDGTILWPGPGGLFALDPDGRLLWKEEFGSDVLSPLIGQDGRVYVAEFGGALHALDLRGSEPPVRAWTFESQETSYGSPALARDGTVYWTAGRELIALEDGGDRARVRWRFEAQSLVEVSPAVAPDGTVILGTNDRFQYGIGPDGRERWRYPREDITYSSPGVTADGAVRFGDHRGFLTVLDSATGKRIARYSGQRRKPGANNVGIWTAPVVDAQRNVYFGTHPGKLFGFSYEGRKLFEIDTGGVVDSYPALAGDGTLLAGSESGELLALRD